MNHESFFPRENKWLEFAPVYEGAGTAEFKSPKGILSGSAKFWFDESGQIYGELEVEHVETIEDLPFGAMQLLSGNQPELGPDGRLSMSFGVRTNE